MTKLTEIVSNNNCPVTPQRLVPFAFAAGLGSVAILVFSIAIGVHLDQGGLLSHNSWLFGMDTARVIEDVTRADSNQRSNAHPLFTTLATPASLVLQRLGVAPRLSAILLNAAAGLLFILAMGWYARRRGLARIDTLLFCGLLASGAFFSTAIAIPDTHLCAMIAFALALCLSTAKAPGAKPIQKGIREANWLGIGVLAWGMTVAVGVQACFIYLSAHWGRWALVRTISFGLAVLCVGLGLARLGGIYTDLTPDYWILDPELRGGSLEHPLFHVLSCFLVFLQVAPIHHISPAPNPGIAGEWVLTFFQWNYCWLGWILCVCWLSLLVAGLVSVVLDRDSRRLSVGLAGALLFTMPLILHEESK